MEDSAEAALTASLLKENVSAIMAETADIVLHSSWTDTPLKEVPIISWLVKAGTITMGIRDRLFLKKLAMFLREATRLPLEARARFKKQLSKDRDLEKRYGESILLLIDKLSNVSKARLMGFAFRRFVEERIDEVTLNRIYSALEFMPTWQLFDLPTYYFETGLGTVGPDAASLYQQVGLAEVYYGDMKERLHCDFRTGQSYRMSYHQPFYRETLMGFKVAEVVRDFLLEPD